MKKLLRICLFICVYLLVSCSLPSWMVKVKQRSHIKIEQLSQDIDPVAPWAFPLTLDIEIPATHNEVPWGKATSHHSAARQHMLELLEYEWMLENTRVPGVINPFTDNRPAFSGTVGNTVVIPKKKGNNN